MTSILQFSLRICAISFCLLIFFSCGKKQNNEAPSSINEKISSTQLEIIKKYTAGTIHYDDKIEISFKDQQIEKNKVGSAADELISISPSIQGDVIWSSDRTITVQPHNNLPLRTQFIATVKLNRLKNSQEESIEDLIFSFETGDRKVVNHSGELKTQNENDPIQYFIEGTIYLSEKTDLKALSEAVEINGDQDIDIHLSQIDDYRFSYISDVIRRTGESQDYKLTIQKKPLDMLQPFSETFNLAPRKQMLVSEVKGDHDGRTPRIQILFSDFVDPNQNFDGLIKFSPNVDATIRRLGNRIIVDGDFKFGETYNIDVNSGISNIWGDKTQKTSTHKVEFSDMEPTLEFASDGFYLPKSSDGKIQFYTCNIKRVHIQVKKLVGTEYHEFANSQNLTSTKSRHNDFNDGYSNNLGVIVKNKTLELKASKNQFVLNEADLSDLFETCNQGQFLIRINFNPGDLIDQSKTSFPIEMVRAQGQIYKPIFVSNIGLTVKRTEQKIYVFATDIETGKMMPDVTVSLLDYNGDVNKSRKTNSEGIAKFDARWFQMVCAKKDDQLTIIKKNEMRWSTSGFDISGEQYSNNSAIGYLYTERGVYRPGDSIHLSCIFKKGRKYFPEDHPARIEVYDPQYNTVFEQTKSDGRDGLYTFAFCTDQSAPTGNYNVQVRAGNRTFYKTIKVETVEADKLRVLLKPDKSIFYIDDENVAFDIEAKYLFGAPASGLLAQTSIDILPKEMKFKTYADYKFSNRGDVFQEITHTIDQQTLDASGNKHIDWKIPPMGKIPSSLRMKIACKVIEKGGNPNEGWTYVDLHPYKNYVGIKDPSGYGYFKTEKEQRFPVVLLNIDGEKLANKKLTYKIFNNTTRWWYDYNSRSTYRLKYRQDQETYVVKQGSITTSEGNDAIPFTPQENGEYLIEVTDGQTGHTTAMFFSAYKYGGTRGSELNAGTLSLKSDKAKYGPGDRAMIKIPNPHTGTVLLTVEQGNKMLSYNFIDPSKSDDDDLYIEVPITSSMIPNAYVSVSVIQEHKQTVNDRPMRMFGILPIKVIDESSKLHYLISTKEELHPNEPFTVNIQTEERKMSHFTIAVVDEGLLSLTQFPTPNPWQTFYKRIGLFVDTYDMFSHVMNANQNDIFQTFSIGGSDDVNYRESQLEKNGKKRFKPVCMFKGPFTTDANGNAKVTFNMPEYNGAVRIMVVGSKGENFGKGDQTVPVRSDVILQPTLPRILKPGDEFTLPISMFRTKETIEDVELNIEIDGPIEVIGESTKMVRFDNEDELLVKYKMRVKEAIGQAQVRIFANAGASKVKNITDIMVTSSSSQVYQSKDIKLENTDQLNIEIPKVGIDGTNRASLQISRMPYLNFDHRLEWLIRYPYGCIEQTTSSVFPQVAMNKLGILDKKDRQEVDQNINAAIDRLKLFQLGDGSFSYWPGNSSPSIWGTNYATHFLVIAKQNGYGVPDYMYKNALKALKRMSKDRTQSISNRVNQVFILSLAGQYEIGIMNTLRENRFAEMNNTEKWMLATAYHLAGAEEACESILNQATTEAKVVQGFDRSYGSIHRNRAIMLYCSSIIKKQESSMLLIKQIATKLSSKDYISTQSSAYMILSIARFFEEEGLNINRDEKISGRVVLPSGEKIAFDIEDQQKFGLTRYLHATDFGKSLQIEFDQTLAHPIFVNLSANGLPLIDQRKSESKNLNLDLSWHNEQGDVIDPATCRQGESIYGHYRVKVKGNISSAKEVALMQILPSGWIIENMRLNNKTLPEWTNAYNLNKEDYLDIRDDRIMWFFDIDAIDTLDFVVKINCISEGKFWLPATICEAMYNDDFKSIIEGKSIEILPFEK